MKKRTAIISTFLSVSLFLTGCSWSDITAKFTGADTSGTAAPASTEKDYVAEECVTLPEYKGIEVDCTVSEEDIEAEIKSVLNDHATEKKVKKGKCKQGDTVNIDFTGKVDGKEFDNGSAEDYSMTIGSSGFIAGFDDGVDGMKVGETKDLKLKFPDDYHQEDLKGKDVVFTVKVNFISETEIPELNDEFVAKNTEQKTVDEYKEVTRQNLVKDKKEQAGQNAYGTVEEKAEVKNYPESLINVCSTQLDSYYRNYMAPQYGFSDFNTFLTQMQMTEETYQQSLKQAAESIAKTQLVTEAIAAKEGITITEDEIKEQIDTVVSQSGQSEEELRKSFQDLYGTVITLEEYYRVTLVTNKVIDFVGENAKIVE